VEFIRWAAGQRNQELDVHLVVNGDVVDFLAEQQFESFTKLDADAVDKFERIVERTAEVWDALRYLIQSGSALTLLLGNHDLELSLPGPRRALQAILGAGRVEFIYDNQALSIGPVLIEHGNRYDAWNVVPHDVLRQVRSAHSRGEAAPELPPIPGSELVIRVMNRYKTKYAFLDLLKPETAAAIPLLAALEPVSLRDIAEVIHHLLKSRRNRFDTQGRPVDLGAISGTIDTVCDPVALEANEALALAYDLVAPGDTGAISGRETAKGLWESIRAGHVQSREQRLTYLHRAIRYLADKQAFPFDVNKELEDYLRPAKSAAARGFKVILFGHTHAPKRIRLNTNSLYINTGTWADLLRLPEEVLSTDETKARETLATFVDGLVTSQLDLWREQFPTFARVELRDNGEVDLAELFLFRRSDCVERVADGVLLRNVSSSIQPTGD
jgi:UDP-2,3-diacylglucosamine pyrophosphatase LpxH